MLSLERKCILKTKRGVSVIQKDFEFVNVIRLTRVYNNTI